VIGVVVDKRTDDFRLDIRGPSLGVLPSLAFEGATKRARPKLGISPNTHVHMHTNSHTVALFQIVSNTANKTKQHMSKNACCFV